ncbi:MAG: FAD-dependent oxidoreductase [Chitinophagales bacterium]
MNRDGALESLWQSGMPAYESKSAKLPEKVDVAIVGGGITGLTTAYLLQKAGRKCTVLEAKNIGFGTTGGTTAHLNTLMDTPYDQIISKFNLEAAQLVAKGTKQALAFIEHFITSRAVDCGFEKAAACVFSQDDEQAEELKSMVAAAIKVGLQAEFVNEISVPISFKTAAQFPEQAKFHPLKYLYEMANAFQEAGGEIIQDCRVRDVASDGAMATITTSKGNIKASKVVYATHIPPGVNLLHFYCAPYRSYALSVKLEDENSYPDDLVYDMWNPYHYYRTQVVNGEKYLIAGGEDHKTGHEENTNSCIRNLEAYVRSHFKVKQVVHAWSSQFFNSVDGLPYIGHLPGNAENVFVATGFGGNGMTYGTLSALVLADLLTTGESEYKLLFLPSRVKPIAGFTDLMKEGADVVAQLFGGWLSIDKISELADIAKGEAKVVRYDNKALALYKDENGKVFALNPSCPHIKCTVSWNIAEKSWDCPCHGSRFAHTGELLTGPARTDLEKLELR